MINMIDMYVYYSAQSGNSLNKSQPTTGPPSHCTVHSATVARVHQTICVRDLEANKST